MRVNTKVVPPRHAEKLANKMPFSNTRNVGDRDNKLWLSKMNLIEIDLYHNFALEKYLFIGN